MPRCCAGRIEAALPAWDDTMPGYHAILGMHAFGLEENGHYAQAESSGRRAVELEPRDGWAHHAVAHVMEMQCRQRDGIAWMRGQCRQLVEGQFSKGPQLVAPGALPLRARRGRRGARAL